MPSYTTAVPEKPATEIAAPTVPRKRRRRAAANGASEDCFTCRKRQTKCDRRRPYCAQCLEIGKECSGYRTQLTWGVGVASRGKLRGLSLPIINSAKTASAVQETKASNSATSATSKSVTSNPIPSPVMSIKSEHHQEIAAFSAVPVLSPNYCSSPVYSNPGYSPATTPIPISVMSAGNFHWHSSGFDDHVHNYTSLSPKAGKPLFRPRPLQRLQTAFPPSYDDASISAPSTGSLGAFSDCGDFPSPSEYPHTPEEIPFTEPFVDTFPDALSHQPFIPSQDSLAIPDGLGYMDIPRSFPLIADDMVSSMSDQSNAEYMDVNDAQTGSLARSSISDAPISIGSNIHVFGSYGLPLFGPQLDCASKTSLDQDIRSRSVSRGLLDGMSIPRSVDAFDCSHLPLRTRFLLDYYDRAICSVLVAFDGPTNPYRMHVFPLLCTARRILTADEIRVLPGTPSREELQYESISIGLLNSQLSNPVSAKDDSVLATLLILCLFHVCDSGFTKFQTQLSGVQKLLELHHGSPESAFVGWIQMFFTWFDVMIRGASADFDLLHISEAFRHAALLYVERLAYPALSPSASNLQRLVSLTLSHIAVIAINSPVNKFLLYPLWIAGTEAVTQTHRDIVRRRCVEITRESGFLNNLSGLEVLERAWAADDHGEVLDEDGVQTGQAFRWRKVMSRSGGEYIVI
ncbi:hypothetical protein P152DRAFT_452558 [Eremomyces bilateralis CBS 781.70]|uniref:Zn(2)-C6 fungal-type domain-containing protein n=1 Tax=Eremomyces bilateralis CBS 781.70 TaxID=1392243 RepID=A0A6G1FSP9_9PEZI|nr:uncharacterized protein P152DRAFT_452558 [Eremomyces bilateralis CBS 781.70]KAF1808750.1 hypothetical protein P152DRAFT_452558 [Eremomyces bilateralis CBS 781.70]